MATKTKLTDMEQQGKYTIYTEKEIGICNNTDENYINETQP